MRIKTIILLLSVVAALEYPDDEKKKKKKEEEEEEDEARFFPIRYEEDPEIAATANLMNNYVDLSNFVVDRTNEERERRQGPIIPRTTPVIVSTRSVFAPIDAPFPRGRPHSLQPRRLPPQFQHYEFLRTGIRPTEEDYSQASTSSGFRGGIFTQSSSSAGSSNSIDLSAMEESAKEDSAMEESGKEDSAMEESAKEDSSKEDEQSAKEESDKENEKSDKEDTPMEEVIEESEQNTTLTTSPGKSDDHIVLHFVVQHMNPLAYSEKLPEGLFYDREDKADANKFSTKIFKESHRIKKQQRTQIPDKSFQHSRVDLGNQPDMLLEKRLSLECPSTEETIKILEKYKMDFEDQLWYPYILDTGSFNREKLRIIETVIEEEFSLGRPIQEWQSRGVYAVGREPHGLTVATNQPEGITLDYLEFEFDVTAISMFEWWDVEEKTMNIGLVVAQENAIMFYQISGINHLTRIWKWTIDKKIKYLTMFERDGEHKLAVTHEEWFGYEYKVSIFGMNLFQNWWFEVSIPGYGKPIALNDGVFIAVIQYDQNVIIYKHIRDGIYNPFKTIISPGVVTLSAFAIGPLNFLAVGGERSAIYQISGGQFNETSIQNYQFQNVELWLPISLDSYRNDVILLFQSKLNNGTHSNRTIDALQWNGQEFILFERSPCVFKDNESIGFSCILDASREKGLIGAGILKSFNNNIYILTASEKFSPLAFKLKTEMFETMSPVNREIKSILKTKDKLENQFLDQLRVIDESLKIQEPNHYEKYLEADNWKIKKLRSPAVHFVGSLKNYLQNNSHVNIAGLDIKDLNFELDISELYERIQNNHKRIQNMVEKLKKAIPKKGGIPKWIRNIKIKGGITVKGNVRVKKAKIKSINNLNVDYALKKSLKKPKNKKIQIHGKKLIRNLKTDNINVNIINGIDTADPFKSIEPIRIERDLKVSNHLRILHDIKLGANGKLNNINLKSDIYLAGKQYTKQINPLNFDNLIIQDTLTVKENLNGYNFTVKGLQEVLQEKSNLNQESQIFNNLSINSLTVSENLQFETINGRPWNDFIERVIMKSKNMTIQHLKVDGKITVKNAFMMENLNSLSYPSEYFLRNETDAVLISGRKTFKNVFHARAVDCEGTINGIYPQNIVTLSTNQQLKNFTFYHLTVTERMNVEGEINGKELDAFLSNPLLTEAKDIRSNVIFKNLVIDGDLIVENRINGSILRNVFKNVIKKSNEPLIVDSQKIFQGDIVVENYLNIQTGFINNKSINDFITVDTDQNILSENINSDVIFENIQVEGTFDGVNLTDLIENTVKISGNQTVMSKFIFEDDIEYPDDIEYNDKRLLQIKELEVTDVCNNWKVHDAIFDGDDVILNAPEFDNLYVDHLIIDGNLDSVLDISGTNLYNFDQFRLSKTQDKIITAPYSIAKSKMNNLHFHHLNGESNNTVIDFLRKANNFYSEIQSGNIDIRNLRVKGKLDVSTINGVDLCQLAKDAIWLNEENHITAPVTFINPVYLKSLQIMGNAHGKNFEKFLNDVVLSTDEIVAFKGRKTFVNGLTIKGIVKTNFINNIETSKLFTTNTEQIIEGTTNILGNVTVTENINVNGLVNGLPIEHIVKFFPDVINNHYTNGNFSTQVDIENHVIDNLINEQLKQNLNNTDNIHQSFNLENAQTDLKIKYNNLKKLTNNSEFTYQDQFIDESVINLDPYSIHGSLDGNGNWMDSNSKDGQSKVEYFSPSSIKTVEIQKIYAIDNFNAKYFYYNANSFIVFGKSSICQSELWKWNYDLKLFEKFIEFENGCVISWETIEKDKEFYLLSRLNDGCRCRFTGLSVWKFGGINIQHITNLDPVEAIYVPKIKDGKFYSIRNNIIYKCEMKIYNEFNTQWFERELLFLEDTTMKFFPMRLSTGFLLTNGRTIYKLEEINQMVLRKNYVILTPYIIDNRIASVDEIVEFTIGFKHKKLYAALWYGSEEHSIHGKIQIYEDITSGKIIQEISAYKPTSLKILQLNNYQTLMLFIENYETIHIYSSDEFQEFIYFNKIKKYVTQLEILNIYDQKIILASNNVTVFILDIEILKPKKREIFHT